MSRRTATGWGPCVRGEQSGVCAGEAGARTTSITSRVTSSSDRLRARSCYPFRFRIESVADLLLPLYVAEIVAEVFDGTVFVTTVKLADDCPASTVTL